ncbi:MAG: zinc transporter ZupT [Anaerocolumna sp.]|nr:zinc transporter ZupT [Anaerocolumna sp.]
MENVLFAFGLTILAGLATGIGSLISFMSKKFSPKFLSISLGFSAGVMIYVSMIEIFTKANTSLTNALGAKPGAWATVLSFFGGMFLIAVIDKLVPEHENPHEIHKEPAILEGKEELVTVEEQVAELADAQSNDKNPKLLRMGLFTALAIGIHNFPEGLATFISALQEPTIAISIAVAIAIHNIPEGMAVSVPIYYATGSRKKAFLYSFLSGLSEPVGALIGYIILRPFINDVVFGIVFASVAGIMVFISLDELLPSAREYGEHHLSIYGMVAGMIVMAISLLLFI